MKVKVNGTNIWQDKKHNKFFPTFLSSKLKMENRPTPFMTSDIDGNDLMSRMHDSIELEERIINGEVELKKGDYIMMLPAEDLLEYKEQACGHMHYFDGEKLISVYTKKVYSEGISNEELRRLFKENGRKSC